MPPITGPLNWTQVYTETHSSITPRLRQLLYYPALGRIIGWKMDDAQGSVVLLHSADGVTWTPTPTDAGGYANYHNPQRVDLMAVSSQDGRIYFVARLDAGASGVAIRSTNDLASFPLKYNALSTRATQNGICGAEDPGAIITNSAFVGRTDPLSGPVEAVQTYVDFGGPTWAATGFPVAATIQAGDLNSDGTYRALCATGANVFVYTGIWTNIHAPLAPPIRMRRWPAQGVSLYARVSAGGGEPAERSRVYSAPPPLFNTWTQRFADQFEGNINAMEIIENDLYFCTVNGTPTGTNLRVYRCPNLTTAPILIGNLAVVTLDHSAFLAYHPGLKKFFLTQHTLAGNVQRIYAASAGAFVGKMKRIRHG